jgi:D-beta-D-heptose 7-phosphate kinase / D-beta-D-heptose 1-phosphate adenosyltransferase
MLNPLSPDVSDSLLDCINRWPSLTLLVIGDAILDSYVSGQAHRLCREAPAPIVSVDAQQDVAGGAANTAANGAGLGGNVTFLSVLGTDTAGDRLLQILAQQGVNTADVIRTASRTTLLKQRILADQQILARLDQGSTALLTPDLEQALLARLTDWFPRCDAVIVSDYSYGIITPRVIQTLAELQTQSSRTLVIDSRCLQNYRTVGATAVKPNYSEALHLLNLTQTSNHHGARVEQLLPYGEQLLHLTGAGLVALTLDCDGAIGFEAQQPAIRTTVDPVPPNQTSGAGDTFVAALTLALAAQSTAADALALATVATTVAVQQPGTTVCHLEALYRLLLGATANHKLLEAGELLQQVQQYRAAGRRIVFTNGCFDILHAGHVTYLAQAKALGDILIVGVNSDDSVRRLKGDYRPVNALPDRLTVLSALSSVDHVVPFAELNPNNLIRMICPDFYVKGGDYSREQLPEVDLVEELGGVVKILPYVDNRSTTRLIHQIRELRS